MKIKPSVIPVKSDKRAESDAPDARNGPNGLETAAFESILNLLKPALPPLKAPASKTEARPAAESRNPPATGGVAAPRLLYIGSAAREAAALRPSVRPSAQAASGPAAEKPPAAPASSPAQRAGIAFANPPASPETAAKLPLKPAETVALGRAAAASAERPARPRPPAARLARLSTPGQAPARMAEKPAAGRAQPVNTVPPTEWEKSQRLKQTVLVQTTGAANIPAAGPLPRPTAGPVKPTAVASAILEPKGFILNAREGAARADGTPVFRDDQGQAKVLNPAEGSESAATYLSKEATDDERASAVRRLAAQVQNEKASPSSPHEAFSRQAERVRRDAPERLAAQAQLFTKTQAADLKAALETPNRLEKPEKTDSRTPGVKAEKSVQADGAAPAVKGSAPKEGLAGDSGRRSGNGETLHPDNHPPQMKPEILQNRPLNAPAPAPHADLPLNVNAPPDPAALPEASLAAARLATLLSARIEWLNTQARPELRLRLTPEGLGEIEARLIRRGARTEVHLSAEREQSGRLLELALPQLVSRLEKAGISVAGIRVDTNGLPFGQSGSGHPDGQNRPEAAGARRDGEDAGKPPVLASKRKALAESALDVLA